MKAKFGIPAIIALVGVVLGLIGFFLGWIDNSTILVTVEYSGYDYLFKDAAQYTVYALFIFVALVGSLMMVLLEPFGKGTASTKMLLILFGIAAFLIPFLIFVESERFALMGLMIEIVAGLILMIGGFLNVLLPAFVKK